MPAAQQKDPKLHSAPSTVIHQKSWRSRSTHFELPPIRKSKVSKPLRSPVSIFSYGMIRGFWIPSFWWESPLWWAWFPACQGESPLSPHACQSLPTKHWPAILSRTWLRKFRSKNPRVVVVMLLILLKLLSFCILVQEFLIHQTWMKPFVITSFKASKGPQEHWSKWRSYPKLGKQVICMGKGLHTLDVSHDLHRCSRHMYRPAINAVQDSLRLSRLPCKSTNHQPMTNHLRSVASFSTTWVLLHILSAPSTLSSHACQKTKYCCPCCQVNSNKACNCEFSFIGYKTPLREVGCATNSGVYQQTVVDVFS